MFVNRMKVQDHNTFTRNEEKDQEQNGKATVRNECDVAIKSKTT